MIGRSMSRAGTTTRVAISRPDGVGVGSSVGAGETEGSSDTDGDGDAGGCVTVTSEGASMISGVATTAVPAVVGSGYVSRPAVMSTTPSAVSNAGTTRDASTLNRGAMAGKS